MADAEATTPPQDEDEEGENYDTADAATGGLALSCAYEERVGGCLWGGRFLAADTQTPPLSWCAVTAARFFDCLPALAVTPGLLPGVGTECGTMQPIALKSLVSQAPSSPLVKSVTQGRLFFQP